MTGRLIMGVVVGGLLGYGAHRFIGSAAAVIPFIANPWMSTMYGMLFGAVRSKVVSP